MKRGGVPWARMTWASLRRVATPKSLHVYMHARRCTTFFGVGEQGSARYAGLQNLNFMTSPLNWSAFVNVMQSNTRLVNLESCISNQAITAKLCTFLMQNSW